LVFVFSCGTRRKQILTIRLSIRELTLQRTREQYPMHYIIAVAQRKGGAGKTTLTVSLAAELHRRGKQVALIDADPQKSACQWAEPGHLRFPVCEVTLADQTALNWARELHCVAENHRLVVVDTAPSERALAAAIGVANLLIVPCTPSGLDLEATGAALEIINNVRRRRQGHPPLILVPNRVDIRTLEGRQLVDELIGFGEAVSPTIGNRSAFVRAFSTGRSVAEMPDGEVGHREIQLLCDLVEKILDTVQELPGT
jgi:chromosome partitioning protein